MSNEEEIERLEAEIKSEPEAGELSKDIREFFIKEKISISCATARHLIEEDRNQRKVIAERFSRWANNIENLTAAYHKGLEACDIIDRLEAQKEKLQAELKTKNKLLRKWIETGTNLPEPILRMETEQALKGGE